MTTEEFNPGATSKNTHQDLIDGCRAGNQKAQFKLFRLYHKTMYNISLLIVNNTNEAEDIMQESFLSAFEEIDTYNGNISFGDWMKNIVLNRSLDAVLHSQRAVNR
jgi:DNA-directed RNA polymerase specialized sigma24 family protein